MLIGELFELLPLAGRQGADFSHQFRQFGLKLVLVHDCSTPALKLPLPVTAE